MLITIAVAAVLILNVGSQYWDDYRPNSRYQYDWQPRRVSYRLTPNYQRTHFEKDQYDNRRYRPERPTRPSLEHDGDLTYRETSYGLNPLRNLDPYTRRAVEQSYRHHTEEKVQYKTEEIYEGDGKYNQKPVQKLQRKASYEETGGSRDNCSMMKVSW